MYGLLMRVSAEAVKELCAKKRHLGGLPASSRFYIPGTVSWAITRTFTC